MKNYIMMKTRKFIIATVWVAVAALVWSCNEPDNIAPDQPQENVVADNLLVGSGSVLNRMRGQGLGGPVGAIFGNFFNGRSGRTADSPMGMIKGLSQGRAENDSIDDENPPCLVETYEDDGQGTYTFTLDFGDGCEYYGEFMKGKLVETGTYSDTNFSSTVTFINFGGSDWEINGTQSYSGTWEESVVDDGVEDSAWVFDANYQFEADLQQLYTDFDYEDDSTSNVSTDELRVIEVNYLGSGTESMDNAGFTVESRTETVDVSTGESFSSQVDSPLYYDFECEEEDVWIFVSGIESGTYTYGDESGSYSIDYGDGSCDNIVLLTENGVSEEVDLGELWDEWEEDCEEGHDGD